MKSGASDPFADDNEDEEAAEPEAVEESVPTDDPATADATAEADSAAASSERASSEDASADVSTEDESASGAPLELPYIYRRDKVKDERPDVHQLFVRDETDSQARDAERDLEKLLGEDVYRLDAREAIYLAGMRHLDEAADVLREWGYDR
ncbi:hypothetical protein [Halarchaeum sp. P4]|uniref:hypothetical protein n=1 Tax=Halarchaeum sp. P4 TaxID=3421639 RepID=UPI003EBFB4BA